MDSKYIKVNKNQQIEKNVTPIWGFACFSQWHSAQYHPISW